MVGSDENHPGVIRPSNVVGGLHPGVGKIGAGMGQNRRALSTINRNIIGAPPHPCAVNKRGALSENNGISTKNLPIPAHRPVTRKFAAQMASKQKPRIPEETKKLVQSVPVPAESEDCAIIDVDDYKAASAFPVPMFVQHTEALLDEIDRMEVEMEDTSEEPVVDIDGNDKKNPLAVVEYIDDIYSYYKKVEVVHYKFELMEETLYLTVNLIDRFLAIQPVVRKKLQLVGVTAMLLACKYEEVSVPVVEDLILISDKAYSRKDVLDMEKLMVNTLQFNMSVPTPYVFMRRFLKAAESDKKDDPDRTFFEMTLNQLELLSFFIIELCLVEYEMLKFPPSLLAAAAVFTAQSALCGYKKWSMTSERHTNYSEDHLMECSRLMVTFHQKAGNGKLTGVHRKYNTSKYGYTAKSEPAHFLLEDRS
ncbi:hypothetical protein C3L33_11249, partial [Rhododendron williamsianum]